MASCALTRCVWHQASVLCGWHEALLQSRQQSTEWIILLVTWILSENRGELCQPRLLLARPLHERSKTYTTDEKLSLSVKLHTTVTLLYISFHGQKHQPWLIAALPYTQLIISRKGNHFALSTDMSSYRSQDGSPSPCKFFLNLGEIIYKFLLSILPKKKDWLPSIQRNLDMEKAEKYPVRGIYFIETFSCTWTYFSL